MAVDGGQVFTAGKCGLVPAMVEQYDEGMTLRNHHIQSRVLFDLFYMSNICISVSLHRAMRRFWR